MTALCAASHLHITPMENSGIVELEKSAPIISRLISNPGHVKPTHVNNGKHCEALTEKNYAVEKIIMCFSLRL